MRVGSLPSAHYRPLRLATSFLECFGVGQRARSVRLGRGEALFFALGARIEEGPAILNRSNAVIFELDGHWYFQFNEGSRILGRVQLIPNALYSIGREPSEQNPFIAFPNTPAFNSISRHHMTVMLSRGSEAGQATVTINERRESATLGISCAHVRRTNELEEISRQVFPVQSLISLNEGRAGARFETYQHPTALFEPRSIYIDGEEYILSREGYVYWLEKVSTGKKMPFPALPDGSIFTPFRRVSIAGKHDGFLVIARTIRWEEVYRQRAQRLIPAYPLPEDNPIPWVQASPTEFPYPLQSYDVISDLALNRGSIDLGQLAREGGGTIFVSCTHRLACYTIEVDHKGNILLFHGLPEAEPADPDEIAMDTPYYSRLDRDPLGRILTVGSSISWPYFGGHRNETWRDTIKKIVLIGRKQN